MKILELTEPSLASLLALIEQTPGRYRHLFRGQANASWSLVPSLYRKASLNVSAGTLEKSYDLYEQQCIERFFREGLPYLPPISRTYSNDRIMAQHFGVPTRFLDWSTDPLVALFFAVEGFSTAEDAAIFMILPDAHYLPEHVAGLGPHQAIHFDPPAIDRRVPAQKSAFTFHPYGPADKPFTPLDQRDIGNFITVAKGPPERGFFKLMIPAKFKGLLHSTLLEWGIDRRNLFPGLEGVGADIAARSRRGAIW